MKTFSELSEDLAARRQQLRQRQQAQAAKFKQGAVDRQQRMVGAQKRRDEEEASKRKRDAERKQDRAIIRRELEQENK